VPGVRLSRGLEGWMDLRACVEERRLLVLSHLWEGCGTVLIVQEIGDCDSSW